MPAHGKDAFALNGPVKAFVSASARRLPDCVSGVFARSRSAAHLRGFRFMLNALDQDV